MRSFIIPIIAGLVVIAVVLAFVLRNRSRASSVAQGDIDAVLRLHGAARCTAAARLLSSIASKQDTAGIVSTWRAIEMPLMDAISDCPPDHKLELIKALDAACGICRHRETAQQIMTMRNSLIR